MNKSELIKKVAEQTSLTQAQAKEAVNSALEIIKEETLENGKVVLPQFGVFKKHVSAEREGRNPNTGEIINLASKTTIKFRAS